VQSYYRILLFFCGLSFVLRAPCGWGSSDSYFVPTHQLAGVGIGRKGMSDAILKQRTALMIESQTFAIMRDPQALPGAQRITGPELQEIFTSAALESGFPQLTLEAIAYLESWGDATAQSPTGPKGIMQFTEETAKRVGLQVIRRTDYLFEKGLVRKRKGKPIYQIYRIPVSSIVLDERLLPEKAIPAAAKYLAQLERRFGRQDWAIFAYHCGEGGVSEFRSLARKAEGLGKRPITVPKVFFGCSPAHNRDLYLAIKKHMKRDYSPTYWFRVKKTEQLLSLYRTDQKHFEQLVRTYRHPVDANRRAPARLWVWLASGERFYKSYEELKRVQGTKLVKAFDNPDVFGFRLYKSGPEAIAEKELEDPELFLHASPAAIGVLTYIAFETRRLHEAMGSTGETFVPLEVTSLVRTLEYQEQLDGLTPNARTIFPIHCTGQVFDVSYLHLPPGQRECLEFVVDDLGWYGALGFRPDPLAGKMQEVGSSPAAKPFFEKIYQEAHTNHRLVESRTLKTVQKVSTPLERAEE